jgi:hypothetical protein
LVGETKLIMIISLLNFSLDLYLLLSLSANFILFSFFSVRYVLVCVNCTWSTSVSNTETSGLFLFLMINLSYYPSPNIQFSADRNIKPSFLTE